MSTYDIFHDVPMQNILIAVAERDAPGTVSIAN